MQAYLAAKYMTGPKADAILARTDATKKKKKRKAGTSAASGSSLIKDDDLSGWAEPPREDDDGEEEVVVASDRGIQEAGAHRRELRLGNGTRADAAPQKRTSSRRSCSTKA